MQTISKLLALAVVVGVGVLVVVQGHKQLSPKDQSVAEEPSDAAESGDPFDGSPAADKDEVLLVADQSEPPPAPSRRAAAHEAVPAEKKTGRLASGALSREKAARSRLADDKIDDFASVGGAADIVDVPDDEPPVPAIGTRSGRPLRPIANEEFDLLAEEPPVVDSSAKSKSTRSVKDTAAVETGKVEPELDEFPFPRRRTAEQTSRPDKLPTQVKPPGEIGDPDREEGPSFGRPGSRKDSAAPDSSVSDDLPLRSTAAAPRLQPPDDDPLSQFETRPERAAAPVTQPEMNLLDASPPSRADDAQLAPDSAPEEPRAAPAPKLSIRKVAPASAVLGEPMVYQILVRNTGVVAAHQVMVEDAVPEGVKIDGSIPQAQLDGRRLIWKLGKLDPEAQQKISVRIVPQAEGTIGGVATVSFSPDTVAAEGSATHLKFDMTAPRQATLGDPVTFRFKVANVGRKAATHVTIRDVLPAGLRHAEGDDLEFEIGSLSAGQSREIELVLTAAQAGRVVNRALVTADGNVSEESSAALEVAGPKLAVSRRGPKRLLPNKQAKFTNLVVNPAENAAPNLHLVETIPAGLEFVAATDGGEFNAGKRTVTWLIERLASGQSKEVGVTLSATSRGAQVSVVRAYDSTGASGETVQTVHVSGVPGLRIEIGEVPASIEPGESVKVPVRLLNRGSDAATAVRATVTIPARMQFNSANAPIDSRTGPGQQTVQFSPIARLEPGHEAVLELSLTGRTAGDARLEVTVECEQIDGPIRREELLTIAKGQE